MVSSVHFPNQNQFLMMVMAHQKAQIVQAVPSLNIPLLGILNMLPLIHPSFKKVFGPGSVGGAVFNLCSATLGAGALSIPSSIHMTGWALGIILLIIGAFISIFTIDLMIIARRASGYASFESLAV